MPNYKYKCTNCEHEEFMSLSMSFDPAIKFCCSSCYMEGAMTRRISVSSFCMKRETVGKWYKDKTGRKLLEE